MLTGRMLFRGVKHVSREARQLTDELGSLGYANTFNPSVAISGETYHVAFRAYGVEHKKPFRAYCAVKRRHSEWSTMDLSDHARSHGVEPVADPKLVGLHGAVYVTFNTGYSATANELFLMRLTPEPGPPQRCLLPDRRPVEKNWGFFASDQGISAVYSLDPLVFIHLASGSLGNGDLTFATDRRAGRLAASHKLTIGTQPVDREGTLLLVGHQKVNLRGKRAYFGRPVSIDLGAPSAKAVTVGPTRMIHDLRSMRRPAELHNPNLLFATYFSGLSVMGRTALMSYGINDVGYGFAQVEVAQLWP